MDTLSIYDCACINGGIATADFYNNDQYQCAETEIDGVALNPLRGIERIKR